MTAVANLIQPEGCVASAAILLGSRDLAREADL